MNTEFYDSNLRTFPAPKPLLDYEDVPFFSSLPEVLRSIRQTLGMDVRFIRAGGTLPGFSAQCFTVKVEGGKSPGCLVLVPSETTERCRMNPAEQQNFLNALALLLGDAYRWQQLFRKYEEELAGYVPVPSIDPNEKRFTETLFDILKNSTKILRCNASAFYALNSKNNTLKLRSCWGLPEERLLDPPVMLHDSLSDLEAVLGQVVILNDDYLFETWGAHEDFATAVCVPVMSPMTIHGTLWFYCNEKRGFGDNDLKVMELITGRIAAELERAALLREKH
jgi:transcriptional regulator with GAF, ATPase, and Fis domain